MQDEIRIAVALILRENGETLLVRKRSVPLFMQAGGTIRNGEAPKAALARRLHAELGLTIPQSRMAPFGCFEAESVESPDHLIIAHVFVVRLQEETIAPTAEIDETTWIQIADAPALPLAPLTRNYVLTLYWQMQFGEDLPNPRPEPTAARTLPDRRYA